MRIETVLASLEEYFDLKKEVDDFIEEPNVTEARVKASHALDDYIQNRFDALLAEERRKATSITKKVKIPNPNSIKFTWDDVVGLIDTLNCPPNPVSEFKQLSNVEFMDKWMKLYKDWYSTKRTNAMASFTPTLTLELSDEEFK